MIAEPDRAAVAVDGRMPDIENGHAIEPPDIVRRRQAEAAAARSSG